ncbi:cation transporter, partial [bacterium]|nr:cation transporter [bacterium]
MLLNVMITAAEVAGGLISGSLALLSDAVHNFSDVISIIVSYVALRLSRRKSTPARTFGFKRAEVLAALFNSSGLIIISFFLFKEAWLRLINPESINTSVMLLVAVIGLMGNLISVLLLRQHSQQNLNVKSAYMHLLSDTLSSVAVILGGVAIYFYKIYWLDPLLVFFIGLYILRESYLI